MASAAIERSSGVERLYLALSPVRTRNRVSTAEEHGLTGSIKNKECLSKPTSQGYYRRLAREIKF